MVAEDFQAHFGVEIGILKPYIDISFSSLFDER
jgi:hypothetical protein